MERSTKVLCIGELLIDFICSDVGMNLSEGENFIKKAGGAPANVAASISRLDGEALMAAKVGADPFGIFLKEVLKEAGVDTEMIFLDKEHNTTLAFVSLMKDGERDFVFNRGADRDLKYDDLDENIVMNSKIIHFGSATALLGGPIKDTYFKVMELAINNDIFISFDPNYRVDLWKGRIEDFIEASKKCLGYADFVKVSDEEIKIISGKENIEEGIKIFHELGAKIVAVTLGKEGTLVSNNRDMTRVGSIKIKSIDSTGAGDAFVGAFLSRVSQLKDSKSLIDDFEAIKEITAFANKVGALVCTKLGAISSLPTLEEVKALEIR
ncbi:MAG: fructokinase [Candidatus Petromonas sp.]|jgi:fructokinase|nr:fructokinase [Candidatus Petromonas sp.]